MDREPAIGDRYLSPTPKVFVVEVIGTTHPKHKLVENEYNQHGYRVGMIDSWDIEDWIFIGNFSKSNQFKSLYERLSGG